MKALKIKESLILRMILSLEPDINMKMEKRIKIKTIIYEKREK